MRAEFTVTRGAFRLDVRIAADDVVAVMGPNGSGKSTLLDVLAGLVRPDAGRVEIGDRDVTALPPHQRRVGLLAQDPLLFPHLTALANVAFGPRARGLPDPHAAARRWLAEVDAAHLADRRPRALSGGQAQRVAIARALAAEPDLLLLDEPFAALDVDAAPALRGLLRRVLRGRAAVIVTHDPLDALALADRVIVIEDGRVVEQGATRAVLSRPRTAFTARVAGLNLIPGIAQPDGLHTDGRVIAGTVDAEPGEPAVAVFRPADVSVYTEPVHGSPRNVFATTVTALEPHGDLIRVRTPELAADLTAAAVADLALEPGAAVYLSVKATEVTVHAATG
ncbi:sulfate/molybdate ABC transporter ATP-binding protein [Actinokineospora sp. UTMC 2448]|uniref:sulfate/molybdate ABC transporter ATP-binding protein n=1 Tax=Actinokineospora sp. UTMC 2448 TaxID=2268449 RepID=UPI002164664F|nr:ABC transporter ATP-binding protein [Actinokineospora sp. UTMC 2448]UVS76793.1 Putative 2-aminoethylphosphonate import ATP-binding protein PhnT [Actinokineospora sp. UTMC 2448]